jgi:hypothetical protein
MPKLLTLEDGNSNAGKLPRAEENSNTLDSLAEKKRARSLSKPET